MNINGKTRQRMQRAFIYLLLAFFLLIAVMPFVGILFTAFKTPA
jgi:ABC-type glycerol-3-phosphate transport system permease component